MTTTTEISLDEQIKEVGREIGLRKAVYPKWVAGGRMTEEQSQQRQAAMSAAYATLKRLQAEGQPKQASLFGGGQ